MGHLNSQHPAIQFTIEEGWLDEFLLNVLAERNNLGSYFSVSNKSSHQPLHQLHALLQPSKGPDWSNQVSWGQGRMNLS